MSPEKIIKHVP